MSNDDNRPRREISRLEDNPFVAFRRFADSQVSSLLNTVFTLPATIANYNNAHLAREECLFGKGDKKRCENLRELEEEIAELRHEGRESFRVGDVQAVLKTSEQLMRLDRQADDLRKGIVADISPKTKDERDSWRDERMMEQFANKKGQEWGWMWDWGFPRPFDCDQSPRDLSDRERDREMRETEAILRLQSEVQRMIADFDGKTWNDFTRNDSDTHTDREGPRVSSWSKSWQWPPPTDTEEDAYSPRALGENKQLKKAGVPWQKAYEDLLREERNATSSNSHDEPSYEYSHDHEDQHDDPPTPKTAQIASFPIQPSTTSEEELLGFAGRDTPLYQKFLELRRQGQLEESTQMQDDRERAVFGGNEATEMDAYEHMSAQQADVTPSPPVGSFFKHEQDGNHRPSILSTLTTTERTVAPDGSVTTKTVLKKRFADGKEESSEMVHVQHVHDAEKRSQPLRADKEEEPKKRNRPSWFWSS